MVLYFLAVSPIIVMQGWLAVVGPHVEVNYNQYERCNYIMISITVSFSIVVQLSALIIIK